MLLLRLLDSGGRAYSPHLSLPHSCSPEARQEVYPIFNLQRTYVPPYIYQQAAARLKHTQTFVGRLRWVVQPHPALLYTANKFSLKRESWMEIKTILSAKSSLQDGWEWSDFSAAGIYSAVGQKELHAHRETFRTCTHITTETIEPSPLTLIRSSLCSDWFISPFSSDAATEI